MRPVLLAAALLLLPLLAADIVLAPHAVAPVSVWATNTDGTDLGDFTLTNAITAHSMIGSGSCGQTYLQRHRFQPTDGSGAPTRYAAGPDYTSDCMSQPAPAFDVEGLEWGVTYDHAGREENLESGAVSDWVSGDAFRVMPPHKIRVQVGADGTVVDQGVTVETPSTGLGVVSEVVIEVVLIGGVDVTLNDDLALGNTVDFEIDGGGFGETYLSPTGASTSFTVRHLALAEGVATTTVTFTSDDDDDSPFSFTVSGEVGPPLIEAVFPPFVPASLAFPVSVSGSRFGPTIDALTVNGIEATDIVYVSPSLVNATLPGLAVGTGHTVSITVAGLEAEEPIALEAVAPPTIESVYPPFMLPGAADRRLTVTGTGFGPTDSGSYAGNATAVNAIASVMAQSLACQDPTWVSPTVFTCLLSGGTGSGDAVVLEVLGVAAVLYGGFQVPAGDPILDGLVLPFSPGDVAYPTGVQVIGSNLGSALVGYIDGVETPVDYSVSFGGTPAAAILSVLSTGSILAVEPPVGASGTTVGVSLVIQGVTATVRGGGGATEVDHTFNPAPILTAVFPPFTYTRTSTLLTLTGSNFGPGNTVTLDGDQHSATVVTGVTVGESATSSPAWRTPTTATARSPRFDTAASRPVSIEIQGIASDLVLLPILDDAFVTHVFPPFVAATASPTPVTLTGLNFGPSAEGSVDGVSTPIPPHQVTVGRDGALAATDESWQSPTVLTANLPPLAGLGLAGTTLDLRVVAFGTAYGPLKEGLVAVLPEANLDSLSRVYLPVSALPMRLTVVGSNFGPSGVGLVDGVETPTNHLVAAVGLESVEAVWVNPSEATFVVPATLAPDTHAVLLSVAGRPAANALDLVVGPDPSITAVSPPFAHVAATQPVSVSLTVDNLPFGANSAANKALIEDLSIVIGGQACESPAAVTTAVGVAGTLTCAAALTTVGAHEVALTYLGVTSTAPAMLQVLAAPTLDAISRFFGPASGGTAVTLTGTNLGPYDAGHLLSLDLGGSPICDSVSYVSDTSVACTTVAHTPSTAGPLILRFRGGATGTGPAAFTAQGPPAVTEVTPSVSHVDGGAIVVISGSGFGTDALVPSQVQSIAFVAQDGAWTAPLCASFTVVDAGTLTCVTASSMSMETVEGYVAVTVDGVTSDPSSLAAPFSYSSEPSLLPPRISRAFAPGRGLGIELTVSAVGLADAASIVPVVVDPDDGTETPICRDTPTLLPADPDYYPYDRATCISALVVAGASGQLHVRTDGDLSTGGPLFSIQPLPVVVSLSPSFGPTSGDTRVTVVGTAFGTVDAGQVGGILVGNTPCQGPTWLAADRLACTVVAGTPSGGVTVTIDGVDSSASVLFTSLPAPTVSIVTGRVSGPSSGGTALTIKGTSFGIGPDASRHARVTVGHARCTNTVVVNPSTITCVTGPGTAGNVGPTVVSVANVASAPHASFAYVGPPVVYAVTPSFGAMRGGTPITVDGRNFGGAADPLVDIDVQFVGGVTRQCADLTRVSATRLTCVTASDAPEPEPDAEIATTVQVVVDGIASSLAVDVASSSAVYTFMPAPTLVALAPSFGYVAGGIELTVTGTGFGPSDQGQVGDLRLWLGEGGGSGGGGEVLCLAAWQSPTRVTCTAAPASFSTGSGAALDVTITVDGVESARLEGAWTSVQNPVVTGFDRDFGLVVGGTRVVIQGARFVGALGSVKFGLVSAAQGSCTIVSEAAIECQTPAAAGGVAGAVDVSVTLDGVTAGSPAQYSYIPLPAISSISRPFGPKSGGTRLILSGTGFGQEDVGQLSRVSINGAACAAFGFTTPYAIECVTPPGAGNGPVVAQFDGVALPSGAVFSYIPGPEVHRLSRAFGPVAGGTPVTIEGAHFGPLAFGQVDSVTFGGEPCTDLAWLSASKLACTVPPLDGDATTPVHVVASVDGVASSDSLVYTYLNPPTVVAMTKLVGLQDGGAEVTLLGSGFGLDDAGQIDSVTLAGVPCAEVAWVSPTSISCVARPGPGGEGAVAVVIDGVAAVVDPAVTWTYLDPAPAITVLHRTFVGLGGRTLVYVEGTNFGDPIHGLVNGVRLEGTSADGLVPVDVDATAGLTHFSSTVLAVDIPQLPLAATGADLTLVVTMDGKDIERCCLRVVGAATVTAVEPSFGPIGEATPVTIRGSGFGIVNEGQRLEAWLSGAPAADVSWVSDIELTAVVPALAVGGVRFLVVAVDTIESATVGTFAYDSDAAPPVVEHPPDGTRINPVVDISFLLPEPAGAGTVALTFAVTAAGAADPNSPHSIVVPDGGSSLDAGLHHVALNGSNPGGAGHGLIHGAVYDLTLVYADIYGHPALPAVVVDLLYDSEPPVPTLTVVSASFVVGRAPVEISWSEPVQSPYDGHAGLGAAAAAALAAAHIAVEPVGDVRNLVVHDETRWSFDVFFGGGDGLAAVSARAGTTLDLAGNANLGASVSLCVGLCCHDNVVGVAGVFDAETALCNCYSGFLQSNPSVPVCDVVANSTCFGSLPAAGSASAGLQVFNPQRIFSGSQLAFEVGMPVQSNVVVSDLRAGVTGSCAHAAWTHRLEGCIDVYSATYPMDGVFGRGDPDLIDFFDAECALGPPEFVVGAPPALVASTRELAATSDGSGYHEALARSLAVTGFYQYTQDVFMTVTSVGGVSFGGTGITLDSTTEMFSRFVTLVPSDVEITAGGIDVAVNVDITSLIVFLAWDPSAGVALINFQTKVDWPYEIDLLTPLAVPDGVEVDIDEAAPLDCSLGTACVQNWEMVASPAPGTCAVTGDYVFDLSNVACRVTDGCVQLNGNVTLSAIESTYLCSVTYMDETDGTSAAIGVFADDTFSVGAYNWFVGDTMYLEITVTSVGLPIEAVYVTEVFKTPQARSGDDSATTTLEATVLPSAVATVVRLEIYLPLSAFADQPMGTDELYIFGATLTIRYDTAKRRSLVVLRSDGDALETSTKQPAALVRVTNAPRDGVNDGNGGADASSQGNAAAQGVTVVFAGVEVGIGAHVFAGAALVAVLAAGLGVAVRVSAASRTARSAKEGRSGVSWMSSSDALRLAGSTRYAATSYASTSSDKVRSQARDSSFVGAYETATSVGTTTESFFPISTSASATDGAAYSRESGVSTEPTNGSRSSSRSEVAATSGDQESSLTSAASLSAGSRASFARPSWSVYESTTATATTTSTAGSGSDEAETSGMDTTATTSSWGES